MSIRDGRLKHKELYLTSDTSFAAYLMLRGYNSLGAIDEGDVGPNGKPIFYIGLTPIFDENHTPPETIQQMETDIASKYDEFENMWLTIPHDPTHKVNFREYYFNTRTCFKSFDGALRK